MARKRIHSPRVAKGRGGISPKALPAACATDNPAATMNKGVAARSGGQWSPRRASMPSVVMRKSHSGMSGSERRKPGAGSYTDWKGALPQVPW